MYVFFCWTSFSIDLLISSLPEKNTEAKYYNGEHNSDYISE